MTMPCGSDPIVLLQNFEEQQKEQESDDAHPAPDLSVAHVAECKTDKVCYTDDGEHRVFLLRCHRAKGG